MTELGLYEEAKDNVIHIHYNVAQNSCQTHAGTQWSGPYWEKLWTKLPRYLANRIPDEEEKLGKFWLHLIIAWF